MTRNQVDLEDLANYLVYFFFSFLSFEWMQKDIPLIGTDLNFELMTFAGPMQEITLTFPRLVLILSLGYLLWTNDLDWSAYTAFQVFAVVALVWMVISPPFVPIMYMLVSEYWFASIAAFFIQSVGFGAVMYWG